MSALSVIVKDQTDARQKLRAAAVLGLELERAAPLGYWRVPKQRSPAFMPGSHAFRWNSGREVFEVRDDKGEWHRAVPDDGFEAERNSVVLEFRYARKEASQ